MRYKYLLIHFLHPELSFFWAAFFVVVAFCAASDSDSEESGVREKGV